MTKFKFDFQKGLTLWWKTANGITTNSVDGRHSKGQ